MMAKKRKARPMAEAASGAPKIAAKVAQQPAQAADAVPAAPVAAFNDLASFGQDNLAAVVQANTALVKGLEEIGQEVYGFAQNSLDSAVSVARALIGARSLFDVLALNRDFARSAFEGLLANSARVSEIGIRTTTEAFGPLGTRVTLAVEKLSRPVSI